MIVLELILIFSFGWIFGEGFHKIKLPKILGYLIAGFIIGRSGLDAIPNAIELAKQFSIIGLAIVKLKVGMLLSTKNFKKYGTRATISGIIPCLVEGMVLMIFGIFVFRLDPLLAGMLGFLSAAVSPTMVSPLMSRLRSKGYGVSKNIGAYTTTTAAIDDVMSIIVFYFFYNIFRFQDSSSLGIEVLWTVFGSVMGIFIGLVIGKILQLYLNKYHVIWSDKVMSTFLYILILMMILSMSFFFIEIRVLDVFSIVIIGYVLKKKTHPEISKNLKVANNFTWSIFSVFLFTTAGALVQFEHVANIEGYPNMVGLALAISFIFVGLGSRYLTIFLLTISFGFTIKERIFLALSTTPKGTVPAALASTPITAMYYLGYTGAELNPGYLIIGLGVLMVLITEPLGMLLISSLGPVLLKKEEVPKKLISSQEKLQTFLNDVEAKKTIHDLEKEFKTKTGKAIHLISPFFKRTEADLAGGLLMMMGGEDNVQKIIACSTRLKIAVVNKDKVNESLLSKLGAKRHYWDDKGRINIIFGLKTHVIGSEMKKWIY